MRLIRANFQGFCQHRKREIVFGERLTAFRGPIGSGKTNAVNGILYALTGDLSRLPGVKADNISLNLEEDEKAFVAVEFEHAGAHGVIRRGLRPSNQVLTIAGYEKSWTKDKEIKAKLEEVLGVSEKIITDHVFVEQWKVFDFLTRPAGETAATFAQLFGLDKARQIHSALSDAKIAVPQAAVDADVVRLRIAAREKEVEDLKIEAAKYDYLPATWNEWDDPDRKVCSNYQMKCVTRVEIVKHRTGIQDRESHLATLEARLLALETELIQSVATLAKSDREAEQANKDLAAWEQWNKNSAVLTKIKNGLKVNQTSLAMLVEPVKPKVYPPDAPHSPWMDDIRTKSAKLDRLRSFVKTFDPATGIGDCPTCFTPTDKLEGRYESVKEDVAFLEAEIADRLRIWHEARNHDRELELYRQKQKAMQSAIDSYEEQLANLPAIEMPTRSGPNLSDIIQTHHVNKLLHNRRLEDKQAVEREMSGINGQILSLKEQIEQKQKMVDELAVTSGQATEAGLRLASKRTDYAAKLKIQAELRAISSNLLEDRQMLFEAEQAVKMRARASRVRDHLEAVRAEFHHEGLPKKVSQEYLESMKDEINQVLADFEATFRVTDVDNLRFMVRKGTSVLPANRLSGGEKVLFAIAFRIVVNSMFASELGLLCLDEPTAGLDEESLSCLDVAMGRLRALSQSRGLQVILITHEKGLDGMFDQVVDLGQP